MTNVPAGAAIAAARDKYWVYRPVLDLIGRSEGTDKRDGYNETLGYGIMLDGRVTKGKGTSVNLVAMTLDQVDALQTRMLKDPDNSRLNSSAAGRYQIVRTTRRAIETALGINRSEKYDADMQDRMACYLLGVRGIDKFLAGRLSQDTLLSNLAMEWASIPTPAGKGHYAGQRAGVTVADVLAALAEVKRRHKAGQPRFAVEVEKPVVPEEVDETVSKKTGWWQKATGVFGAGGFGGGLLWGVDWQTLLVIAGVTVLVLVLILLLRRQIIAAVQDIRGAVEG